MAILARLSLTTSVARKLGLTEARLTQVLSLLYLSPDIQLWMLELVAIDGVEPTNEKELRPVADTVSWEEQRHALAGTRMGSSLIAPRQLVRCEC